ncbi:hypothetical protein ACHAXN_005451 [Cyclotella atomus]
MSVQESSKQSLVQERIQQISQLKHQKEYKEADRLKMILLKEHSIQLFCRSDGSIGWAEIDEQKRPQVKKISWSLLPIVDESLLGSSYSEVPLIIATVNLPHYRNRLQKTLECLSSPHRDGKSFHPVKCIDMIRLDECPSIGANRIVFEGWMQVILPSLLNRCETEAVSIVFVAEDDVRLFSNSPGKIYNECNRVFHANPELYIMSLGHRHAPKKPSRRQRRRVKRQQSSIGRDVGSTTCSGVPIDSESPLLAHLQDGGKVHGSTLLAIRYPHGLQALDAAMSKISFGKRGHFDQFLFHSTDHDLGIAFADPPLVGWSEVQETLTCVGSGYRRQDGGRVEYCPPEVNSDVRWVGRKVVMG